MSGLAGAVMKLGGMIYTNTHVAEFSSHKDYSEVTTKDGWRVKAKYMIVATNVPVNDRVTL
jgi:flavin-dependent dehydrogenase